MNTPVDRTRRQTGNAAGDAAVSVGVNWAAQSVANAFECRKQAGCHKGYCWAWCGKSLIGGEWCYTTRTYSQSFQYVGYTSDSKCDKCWKCAGSYTL